MQELVFKSEGFKDFKEKAGEITNIFNDQWLRVEMDVCKRNTVMAESFRKIEETKDLYPYWVYHTMLDDKVRDEHAALEGLVFRVGDPEGDNVFPQNDWNDRCWGESVDDQYLKEENKQVSKGEDYLNEKDPESGKPYVNENFRFNQYHQGAMPNNSSYSEVLSSANKGNAALFDMPTIPQVKEAEKLTGLTIDEAKKVMSKFEVTKDEKSSIGIYTASSYNPINQFHRGIKKEISSVNNYVSNTLEKFLIRAPKVSATTYRGLGLSEYNVDQFITTLKKDAIWADKGFMSTTYDKAKALEFGTTDRVKCLVEIKGKKGVLIESLSDMKEEKEVLFNKGSQLKVKDFKIKRDKAGIFTEIFVSLVEL